VKRQPRRRANAIERPFGDVGVVVVETRGPVSRAERAAELGDERRAADVVGKLNEVAARCRDAVSSARSGATLDEARAAYEAAVDTYRQLPETAKATHRGVAATEAVRMAPATGGFELIAATASQAGQGLARTADQVGQRLAESPAVTEGAIVVIRSVGYATVVAIGVATGLFLLYANNLTWGGLSDQIAALLWGMGVHQIGGGTFGGVTEMAATLRSGGTLA